jgi:hypothetical protein
MKAAVSSSLAICNCSMAMKKTKIIIAYSEKVDTVRAPSNSDVVEPGEDDAVDEARQDHAEHQHQDGDDDVGDVEQHLVEQVRHHGRPRELATVTIMTRMISQ